MQSLSVFFITLLAVLKMTNQSKICSGRIRHKNCYLLPPDDRCGLSDNGLSPRIVQGTDASQGEFPWLVQLYIRDKGVWVTDCGGSLINEKYVVTAAHCCYEKAAYRVRVGGDNSGYGMDIKVESYVVHRRYDRKKSLNDIALLRLQEAVDMDKALPTPVCLPMQDIFKSGRYEKFPFVAAGFGICYQTKKADFYPETMQKVTLKLLPLSQCKKIYKQNDSTKITASMICTGHEGGRDTCNGDSGGPLMTALKGKDGSRQHYLSGVISFGDVECGEGLPNVHTRVTKYLTWILDNIEP